MTAVVTGEMGTLRISEMPNRDWRIEQFSASGKLLHCVEGPFFTLLYARQRPRVDEERATIKASEVEEELPKFLADEVAKHENGEGK